MHAKIRIADTSNKIPLIRFFSKQFSFLIKRVSTKSIIPVGSTLHLKRQRKKESPHFFLAGSK